MGLKSSFDTFTSDPFSDSFTIKSTEIDKSGYGLLFSA